MSDCAAALSSEFLFCLCLISLDLVGSPRPTATVMACEAVAKKPRLGRARAIKTASDCTGLNAAQMAIEMLGLEDDCTESFASDVCEASRKVLLHNFKLSEKQIYHDICERDHHKAPKVHVYSAGFPCQSFSSAGLGQGLGSSNGQVSLHCLSYIAAQLPKVFILENVPALVNRQHWDDFAMMMNFLMSIKLNGERAYKHLSWNVLNSLDYGAPQSRQRLFIVGLLHEHRGRRFDWPAGQSRARLADFLDGGPVASPPQVPTTATEQRNYLAAVRSILGGGGKLDDMYVADLGGGWQAEGHANMALGYSPCLTRTRCASSSYYLFGKGRKMTLTEMLRLQGVSPTRLRTPPGVSERQMRAMVGNAFTVSTFAHVLDRALFASGLTHHRRLNLDSQGCVGNEWPPAKPRSAPTKAGSVARASPRTAASTK